MIIIIETTLAGVLKRVCVTSPLLRDNDGGWQQLANLVKMTLPHSGERLRLAGNERRLAIHSEPRARRRPRYARQALSPEYGDGQVQLLNRYSLSRIV